MGLLPSDVIILIITINKSPILHRHCRELSRCYRSLLIKPLTYKVLLSDPYLSLYPHYNIHFQVDMRYVIDPYKFMNIAAKNGYLLTMKWLRSIGYDTNERTIRIIITLKNHDVIAWVMSEIYSKYEILTPTSLNYSN